jgi:hypothetical protein
MRGSVLAGMPPFGSWLEPGVAAGAHKQQQQQQPYARSLFETTTPAHVMKVKNVERSMDEDMVR